MPQLLYYLSSCLLTGLLCDLLWSDPDKDQVGWGESDRGVSFTFGPDIVSMFLSQHNLSLIVRSHQVLINMVTMEMHVNVAL